MAVSIDDYVNSWFPTMPLLVPELIRAGFNTSFFLLVVVIASALIMDIFGILFICVPIAFYAFGFWFKVGGDRLINENYHTFQVVKYYQEHPVPDNNDNANVARERDALVEENERLTRENNELMARYATPIFFLWYLSLY